MLGWVLTFKGLNYKDQFYEYENLLFERINLFMFSLLGYALLSFIIVLFLKPFLNIDRSIAAYCFPFGLIYIVLLVSADPQMFEVAWHRYLGIIIGIGCELIFIIGLVRHMNRQGVIPKAFGLIHLMDSDVNFLVPLQCLSC